MQMDIATTDIAADETTCFFDCRCLDELFQDFINFFHNPIHDLETVHESTLSRVTK